MNGYELSRRWFDFAFTTQECKVYHTAIYMWIIELNNRLGWKKDFGLPANSTMEGLSIGNKGTYYDALKDLENWGFIKIVKEAKNQYQSTIISVCCDINEPALSTALDSALHRHEVQHSTGIDTAIDDGIGDGIVPIDKPQTINHKPQTSKPQTVSGAKAPERERQKNEFYEVFQEWFTTIAKVPYDMKQKDWVGVAEIKKYCEKNCAAGFEALDSFRWVLANYHLLPKYYQENRNPKFIASRLSEIIGLIKAPAANQLGRQQNNNNSTTEALKRLENEFSQQKGHQGSLE
jgi:hypothetical protein